MTTKLFWFDTETTGLSPIDSSMVQLAGLVEIDGEIKEEVNLLFKPDPKKKINLEALAVNKRTEEELSTFPDAKIGICCLQGTFEKYVNRFDSSDKFVPVGFNVNFDLDFLRETWRQALPQDRYGVGCFFFNAPIDIRTYLGKLVATGGLRLPNYKLVTACCHFDIPMGSGAHDALNDIRATRELMYRCIKEGA